MNGMVLITSIRFSRCRNLSMNPSRVLRNTLGMVASTDGAWRSPSRMGPQRLRAKWGMPALAAIGLFLAMAPTTPRLPEQAIYPPDFTVIAGAGGVMAAHPNRLVVIDASGAASFCFTAPADRDTGRCTTLTPFTLTTDNLNTIWNAVQTNGFFALPSESLNKSISDGTFAHLVIKANGVTHEVLTQNQAVDPLDNIVKAMNSVLPSAYRLKYNAIAP